MNSEREKLPWSQDTWKRIDKAVHDEAKRTKIAAHFIPLGPVSVATPTIPSDGIKIDGRTLTVDEVAVTPLIELWVEFKLTQNQVEREEELRTAETLASRAANLLSQAEDVVIFQGQTAIDPDPNPHPLFRDEKVHFRFGPAGQGLLNAVDPANQVIQVQRLTPKGNNYGENTFGKVSEAYSRLQSGEGLAQAHYGPYALALHNEIYADTFAPLKTTLIMPADRIKPLVTKGLYGTGTLPPRKGVLVSLGGNTMDLVVGIDATTSFSQIDPEGKYCLRVFKKFALRLKDSSAIIRLEFQ